MNFKKIGIVVILCLFFISSVNAVDPIINPPVTSKPFVCTFYLTRWMCDIADKGAPGATGIQGIHGINGTNNFSAIYFNASLFTSNQNSSIFINSTNFNVTSNYTVFDGATLNYLVNNSYVELSPSVPLQTITKKLLIDGTFEVKNTTASGATQGDIFVNTSGKFFVVGRQSGTSGDHTRFQVLDRHGNKYLDIHPSSGVVVFGTSSGELFRYSPDNRIGILTTSPTDTLHVVGSIRFASLGAGTMMTDANGVVYIISDEKLKTNIKPFSISAIKAIQKIIPITSKFKPESGLDTINTYAGFSAQNLETAIPEAVFTKQDVTYKTVTTKGKLGENENADISTTIEIPIAGSFTKSISDRAILATLILGIQEQQAQIDAQNEQIKILTERIDKAGIK